MSEDNDPSQKTEQPTPQRLEKAKEKGQIATSREVVQGFGLMALTLIIGAIIPWTFPSMARSLAFFLEHSHELSKSNNLLYQTMMKIGEIVLLTFGTSVLFIIAAAIGAGFLQTGLNISFEALKPKFSKISPMGGLKRLFGVKALVEFLKNVVKVILVMTLSVWILWPKLQKMVFYQNLSLNGLLGALHQLTLLLFSVILMLVVLMAALDYAWQKFQFMKNMRMTRQEIKDEAKDQEGDPQLKGRLRQMQRDRARQRMMQRVPEATMIITNPTHYAVALKYDVSKMAAPQVIAKGMDAVALRIREMGEGLEIPLIENPTLARALYANVEIDDEIPLEYYEVVAVIVRQLVNAGKIKMDLS